MTRATVKEERESAAELAQALEWLVNWRISRGLSQRDVAERMGTAQSWVSDIENGVCGPPVPTLQRYARAMGCRLVMRFDVLP